MRRFLLAGLFVAAAASARPVAGVPTASSSLPPTEGVRYGAANLVDGRVETAWIEGERGSGLGSWVQLDLPAPTPVRALKLWNGYWASGDLWQRHNRVKDLEVTFSDGSKAVFTLKDAHAPEVLVLPAPVTTTSVKLKVRSVYSGTTFGDTPLSELVLLDTQAELPTTPVRVTASSAYPADADATYEPWSVADGQLDTAWCEGDKGDGVGQWLELRFAAPTAVSTLRLHNGLAADAERNAGTGQPTSLRLAFDGGAEATVVVAPGPQVQEVSFPAHTTQAVRVTVASAAAGSQYADVCVSELAFGP